MSIAPVLTDTVSVRRGVAFPPVKLLRFVRADSRKVGYFGKRCGRQETGGVRRGAGKISVLAASTCRVWGLNAADEDYTWFSLKFPGLDPVHLREDDFITFDGVELTVEGFYTFQRMRAIMATA